MLGFIAGERANRPIKGAGSYFVFRNIPLHVPLVRHNMRFPAANASISNRNLGLAKLRFEIQPTFCKFMVLPRSSCNRADVDIIASKRPEKSTVFPRDPTAVETTPLNSQTVTVSKKRQLKTLLIELSIENSV